MCVHQMRMCAFSVSELIFSLVVLNRSRIVSGVTKLVIANANLSCHQ